MNEITHRCPPIGSGVMPCCGRTPFEVPRTDRMTEQDALVNCSTGDAHVTGNSGT